MQNLKIAIAFLCAILMCSIPLSAQFDFRKGFILTNEGDTIQGFVKDQTFDKLSRQVLFKIEKNVTPIVYLPADLKAFAFNDGDVFVSFDIDYTGADHKGNTTGKSSRRFLNQVIEGEISLYELTSEEKPLFIQKEGQVLQLLCLKEVLVTKVYDENGVPREPKPGAKYKDMDGRKLIEREGQFFRLTNEYIDILKSEFSSCDRVVVKEKIPLRKKEIAALILEYNKQCAPESYQRFIDRQKKSPVGRFTVYTSSPTPYYEKFGGVGGGAMIEMGGETFSANFGMEYVIGSKNAVDEYNYKMFITTLRGNYRPFKSGKFSPYFFTGISMNATSRRVDIAGFKKRHFVDFEIGGGVDIMLSDRFFIKGEVAYPHFPNARLGIGMKIK